MVTEAVARGCSVKKGVPKDFAEFTRKHLCRHQACTSLKRDSGTGAFLWILRNF